MHHRSEQDDEKLEFIFDRLRPLADIPFPGFTYNNALSVHQGQMYEDGLCSMAVSEFNHFLDSIQLLTNDLKCTTYVEEIEPKEPARKKKPKAGNKRNREDEEEPVANKRQKKKYRKEATSKSGLNLHLLRKMPSSKVEAMKKKEGGMMKYPSVLIRSRLYVKPPAMKLRYCRDNKVRYAATLMSDWDILLRHRTEEGKFEEEFVLSGEDCKKNYGVEICQFPVWTGSKICRTMNPDGSRKSAEELIAIGEDPIHKGGTIIDGVQYFFESLEVRPKQIMLRFSKDTGAFYTEETSEINREEDSIKKPYNSNLFVNLHKLSESDFKDTKKRQKREYPTAVLPNNPSEETREKVKTLNQKTLARASRKAVSRHIAPFSGFMPKETAEIFASETNASDPPGQALKAKCHDVRTQQTAETVPWLTVSSYINSKRLIPVIEMFYVFGITTVDDFLNAIRLGDNDSMFKQYEHVARASWGYQFTEGLSRRGILEKLGRWWSENKKPEDDSPEYYIKQAEDYVIKSVFGPNYNDGGEQDHVWKLLNLCRHCNLLMKAYLKIIDVDETFSYPNHGIQTLFGGLSDCLLQVVKQVKKTLWANMRGTTISEYLTGTKSIAFDTVPLTAEMFRLVGSKTHDQQGRMNRSSSTQQSSQKQRVVSLLNDLQHQTALLKVQPGTDPNTTNQAHKVTHLSIVNILSKTQTAANGPNVNYVKYFAMGVAVSHAATQSEDDAIDAVIARYLEPGPESCFPALVSSSKQRKAEYSHQHDVPAYLARQRNVSQNPRSVYVRRANLMQRFMGSTVRPQELVNAMIDLKRYALAHTGMSQLAVTWNRERNVITIYTTAERAMKRMFFLDRKTQLPVFTQTMIDYFTHRNELSRSAATVNQEPDWDELIANYKQLCLDGSLVWVDTREIELTRISESMGCLLSQSSEAVSDRKAMPFVYLNPTEVANQSAVESIMPTEFDFGVRRIAGESGMNQAIGHSDSGTMDTSYRTLNLDYGSEALIKYPLDDLFVSLGVHLNAVTAVANTTGKGMEDGFENSRDIVGYGFDRVTSLVMFSARVFLTLQDMLEAHIQYQREAHGNRRKVAPETCFMFDDDVVRSDEVIVELNAIKGNDKDRVLHDQAINPLTGLPTIGRNIRVGDTVVKVFTMSHDEINRRIAEMPKSTEETIMEMGERIKTMTRHEMNSIKYLHDIPLLRGNVQIQKSQYPLIRSNIAGQIRCVRIGQSQTNVTGLLTINVGVYAEARTVLTMAADKFCVDMWKGVQSPTTEPRNECSVLACMNQFKEYSSAGQKKMPIVLDHYAASTNETFPHDSWGNVVQRLITPSSLPSRKISLWRIAGLCHTASANPDLDLRSTGRSIRQSAPCVEEWKADIVHHPVITQFKRPDSLKGDITQMQFTDSMLDFVEKGAGTGDKRLTEDPVLLEIAQRRLTSPATTQNPYPAIRDDVRTSLGLQYSRRIAPDQEFQVVDHIAGYFESILTRFWEFTAHGEESDILTQLHMWAVGHCADSFESVWEEVEGQMRDFAINNLKQLDLESDENTAALEAIISTVRTRFEEIYSELDPDEAKLDRDPVANARKLLRLVSFGFVVPDDLDFPHRKKLSYSDAIKEAAVLGFGERLYQPGLGNRADIPLTYGPMPAHKTKHLASFSQKNFEDGPRDVSTHNPAGCKRGYMEIFAELCTSAVLFSLVHYDQGAGTRVIHCNRCDFSLCHFIHTPEGPYIYCPRCKNAHGGQSSDVATTYAVQQFFQMAFGMGVEFSFKISSIPDFRVPTVPLFGAIKNDEIQIKFNNNSLVKMKDESYSR